LGRSLSLRERSIDLWRGPSARVLGAKDLFRVHDTSGERRVGVFFSSLAGGGIERMMLATAGALRERGYAVDVVVAEANGPLAGSVPDGVQLLELQRGPTWLARKCILQAEPPAARRLLASGMLALKLPNRLRYLPSLIRYFREEHPNALLTAGLGANLLGVWARNLACSPARVVASQRNTLSCVMTTWTWKRRVFPALIRRNYLAADALIAVSEGVADDLASHFGVPRDRITVVYNPVVSRSLRQQASSEIDHSWFVAGAPPVVLGVGRLDSTKDYRTLIRAFARLRQEREARLMILGAAKDAAATAQHSAELMALAAELGVSQDVALPGFVPNPFAYMARAGAFVLSSRWEGFGNVLVEAMACGCPVVSTDCPSGPAEILDCGRYGPLVPVGDDAAMAGAIIKILDAPPPAEELRARAALFSVGRAVDQYLDLMFAPSSSTVP
jgi:glycosyltransferase involved in cell wall biosynthesis